MNNKFIAVTPLRNFDSDHIDNCLSAAGIEYKVNVAPSAGSGEDYIMVQAKDLSRATLILKQGTKITH